MAWRLANSLVKLRDQLNAAYPNRSKISDGTIGDAAHQASASDHNPNAAGVVCAMDITHSPQTGLDAHALADSLRVNRHPDLKYIISNRRIAGAWSNWAWQAYNGSNPHSSHIHVSVGRGNDGQSTPPYDDTNDWAIGGGNSPAPGKKSNEQIADEVLAGKWGNNPQRRDSLIAAGYDYNAIQAIVNGKVGNPTTAPRKSNEVIAEEVLAGAWGNNPERQQRLQAAGYDYAAIQAIVNQKVGSGGAPAQSAKLSNDQVANQVIAGAWGNGPDRRAKLQAAGYDYNAVQSLVNQKLGQGVAGKKSNDQVANEVLAGNWGNGQERKDRLAAAGYDYGAIQSLVNRKLGL